MTARERLRWITRATLAILCAPMSGLHAQRVEPAVWVDRVMAMRSYIGNERIRWHPEGQRLLFTSGIGGRNGLWTVAADGGFPLEVVPDMGGVPFQLAHYPQWSPSGDQIAYVSDGSSPNGQTDIWIWSAADGRRRALTRVNTRIGGFSWSPDGSTIAFSAQLHGNMDVFTVSVSDGATRRLTSDTRYETTPIWTPDGKRIVYVLVDEQWKDHDYIEVQADGSRPRVITQDRDLFDYNAGTSPNIGVPQLSPDGSTLVFLSWRSGFQNYWKVPMTGGNPSPVAAAKFDQSNARWSPDGRQLLFTENHDGTHDLRVVAAAGGPARVLVRPRLGVAANAAWSPDGTRISFTMQSPTESSDLFVIPAAGGTPVRVTRSGTSGMFDKQFVEPTKIRYRSDTLALTAYLYTPRDIRPGERRPLIVFGHGGPTSQFNDTFEQQMQYFTGLGYVVLAPNFRGSSGYGKAFTKLNDKCWAHCDLDDLIAGARHVERTLGIVDTMRVGITGTSHGGLLSMAGATFAKGFFKASIPHGGTADRMYYYRTQELRHIQQAHDEFGPMEQNEALYRYVSPFYHVSQVDTPMFVIWGEGKWPGSLNSKRYVEELERQYKPHQWKAYQGENYYVSGRANVRQMLLDMTEFFDRYLGVQR